MTRSLIAVCCLFSLVTAAWIARADEPAAIGTNMGIQIDLKTELQKGLKARRPCEFQYIDQITAMIEAGQLPRSLVDSTFIWARKQPGRQLQYFQFALRARADQLGIATPNLQDQFISPFTGKLPPSSVVSSSAPAQTPGKSILGLPSLPSLVSTSTAQTTSSTTSPPKDDIVDGIIALRTINAANTSQPGLTSSAQGLVTRTFSRIFANRSWSSRSNPLSSGS